MTVKRRGSDAVPAGDQTLAGVDCCFGKVHGRWSWIALAPGISCFVAGKEYAHGSLSLQECLVPELKVWAAKTPPAASIKPAIEAWTLAVQLEPRNFDALYNLAVTLAREDRAAARPYLEQFLKTAPPARYAKDRAEVARLLNR